MGVLLMLVYLLLSLLSLPEVFPALNGYKLLEIIAGLAVIVSLPALLTSPVVRVTRQFWIVTAFIVWTLCSWFPHGWLGGIRVVFKDLSPPVIVYYLSALHLQSHFKLSLMRIVLVGMALFITINGVQAYRVATVTHESMPYVLVQHQDNGPDVIRIQGLGNLGDPNIFSQLLLVLLPILFVSSRPKGMGMGKLLAIPLMLAFLGAIYLSGSRGAILGLAALIGLVFRQRYPKIGTWVGGALGVAVIGASRLAGSRSISVSGGMDRLAIWSDGISLFKRSPIWGMGYHDFPNHVFGMTAHNSFLLCAAELGFIGLFLWTGGCVLALYQLSAVSKWARLQPLPANVVLGRWANAVKLSLLVYLFTGFFLSDTYQMPLYLLLGLSAAIYSAMAAQVGPEKLPISRRWPLVTLGTCVSALVMIYIMLRIR
jgi:putative inorganic carbon (HCO3(-)) transporter